MVLGARAPKAGSSIRWLVKTSYEKLKTFKRIRQRSSTAAGSVSAETHPITAGVLWASLRLRRDSDGSSVDVCQDFPPFRCRGGATFVSRRARDTRRASHKRATERQTNESHESVAGDSR